MALAEHRTGPNPEGLPLLRWRAKSRCGAKETEVPSVLLQLLLTAVAAAAVDGSADIVITAERTSSRVLPPTVELGDAALLERQPRTAADAVDQLRGVSVRTNSRGETIARVRGSEERQTQVFLDGAPLAVPWDGRADIGVLPAGLIGTVRATKGAVPLEYGTNAVAGAVDLLTRSGGPGGFRAMGSAGPLGFAEGAAIATLPAGGFDFTFAGSAMTRDAQAVASLDALPFSQPRTRGRLNTDLRTVSGFGAVAFETGPLTIRTSLLHFDARRGIAPESDRDPAENAPRYWRYPDIRQTQLNLFSQLALSDAASLRLVGWRQWFEQTILQFTDASYETVRTRQDDEDDTLGGRFVLTTAVLPFTVRLVGSAQTSRHAQRDQLQAAPRQAPDLIYRQNLYTAGAEADATIGVGRATLGVAYDHSANPRTGDKPGQPDRGALAFSAAYRAPLGNGWSLAASGGRRNRFPSSRELFGEALGRFLPNPGLKPEQSWLGDIELTYAGNRVRAQINPFVSRARDTIAQRIVTVDGRRLRQRYNLSGSIAYGVDGAVTAQITEWLGIEADATWLRARADHGSAAFRRLPQRPALEAGLAVSADPAARLNLRAELHHVGSAVDLGPDGDSVRLASGTEVNLRARWQVTELWRGRRLALTASADNVTDDVITLQLGLPLPGRSFRLGIQLD
jgi:iron complex outermembrane receptor protein